MFHFLICIQRNQSTLACTTLELEKISSAQYLSYAKFGKDEVDISEGLEALYSNFQDGALSFGSYTQVHHMGIWQTRVQDYLMLYISMFTHTTTNTTTPHSIPTEPEKIMGGKCQVGVTM